MRGRRVPLRRSLVVRLLATSILVAVCAIAATAWLAVQSTTRAIQQEQGRSLSDDRGVYDLMLGYAATHKDWAGIGAVVDERARKLGRRITLMTEDRRVIVDSSAGPSLRAARPSATVDPLHVDIGLTGDTERIDPRAVGPYRLPAKDREFLGLMAAKQLACMRGYGVDGEIVTGASGRPAVRPLGADPKDTTQQCVLRELLTPTKTEQKALATLSALTAACAGGKSLRSLQIMPDFTVWPLAVVKGGIDIKTVQSCLEKSRQTQLKPYVAPAALLFVTDPGDGAALPVFNLSRANAIRIALVTGGVLIVAILVTVLVGRRLVRPLRTLTAAAIDDRPRVPVTTRDEIGYLANALNDLSERREQTEQQRKAMVSDVAHELRTPLTNIRSWLEAAQDGLVPADPQLLGLLLDEAVQLQHIIDDLRDLAAADAGSLRLHPEQTYVNDALAQVAEAHRGAAEAAGIDLRTEYAADPEVRVDPVRVRQLVGNLVSNAVRHTPAGGTVTIRSAVSDGTLVVDVADTGEGIADGDLPKVFDRFWRADGSRTRSTGGSGLGLAIARQLARAHGGDITATSRAGQGSVFTVRLPSMAVAVP
jgi:two-component system, OmpR family, sensor histidine kinase BaeS